MAEVSTSGSAPIKTTPCDNSTNVAQSDAADTVRRVSGVQLPKEDGPLLWFDSKPFIKTTDDTRALLARLLQFDFNGICLYPENVAELIPQLPGRFRRMLHVDNLAQWETTRAKIAPEQKKSGDRIAIHCVASKDRSVLEKARHAGWETCYRTLVDDAKTLHDSFEEGRLHSYVMISFRDPTNIPLELVIASLQKTDTILIKETHNDIDDAIVSLGVLEVGADGVMACFSSHRQVDEFQRKLAARNEGSIPIQVGTVSRTVHLGLGYRSCIDTTTLFCPHEGLVVGSTSTGGILCCPEVFHLPYMDLRPFRVNAAAVHSYLYNIDNRTNYLSELKAGSPVMLVSTSGKTKRAYVGRIKTEIRPLLLIECMFPDKTPVNIIVQDDWHVRIFSDQGTPSNVTDLKPGDKVLGYTTEPGRHVGIKVDEHIIEV